MYYSRNPTPFPRASVSNLCIIMCRNLEIIARENRRVIKNGQSRDTDNIGHTRYRTKTNKTQQYNTTQHRKLKGWTNGTPPIIRRKLFRMSQHGTKNIKIQNRYIIGQHELSPLYKTRAALKRQYRAQGIEQNKQKPNKKLKWWATRTPPKNTGKDLMCLRWISSSYFL